MRAVENSFLWDRSREGERALFQQRRSVTSAKNFSDATRQKKCLPKERESLCRTLSSSIESILCHGLDSLFVPVNELNIFCSNKGLLSWKKLFQPISHEEIIKRKEEIYDCS